MQKMMLSCKKATELIDKKIHSGINREEKVKLYFHTIMCSACSNYEKQSFLIDKALKNPGDSQSESNQNHAEPTEGMADRIIQKLEK